MKITQVKIPITPLSINAAFQGRRYKTQRCREYENDLWFSLPKKEKITGKVSMTLEFSLVHHATTDVSNLVKILEDILVKRGYIEDDRMVYELHLYKSASKKDSVRITISKP